MNRTQGGRTDATGFESTGAHCGGAAESVLEPQWDRDGTLYFISDRSGFWNLYAQRDGGVHAVWPRAAEFAIAVVVRSVRTMCSSATAAPSCASASAAWEGSPSSI